MYFKCFYLLLILQLTSARYTFEPEFYAEDSAIIIEADKQIEQTNGKSNSIYHIIPTVIEATTAVPYKTTTTTTATTYANTSDEFPSDLLIIAQQKLGVRHLDEIPSINELGELLGTKSADETLQYVRQLTTTDQGIALLKAYIESTDYTDNVGTTSSTTTTTASSLSNTVKPQPSILERMATYLMNWLPVEQETVQEQSAVVEMTTTTPTIKTTTTILPKYNSQRRPVLVRNSLPYHYPIPMRPVVMPHRHLNSKSRPGAAFHMSMPKKLRPAYIEHLARLANIPAKNLEIFLAAKPQLAQLAERFGHYAFSNAKRDEQASSQLFVALQRAISQDEDLQKLLSSTKTLQ